MGPSWPREQPKVLSLRHLASAPTRTVSQRANLSRCWTVITYCIFSRSTALLLGSILQKRKNLGTLWRAKANRIGMRGGRAGDDEGAACLARLRARASAAASSEG